MVNFGSKVKRLRLEKGLTQQQLANLLGVAVSAISSYESGSRYPSYEVLISISHIFHVSVDYLLGLEKRKTIDVSDLNDAEIAVIMQMIEILKNKK